MMLDGLTNSGSLAVLERLVQFTEVRHQVLVDDIANLSTPYFKPRDLSPKSFQEALSKAVEERRQSAGGQGELRVEDTQEIRFTRNGMEVRPGMRNENILFHDQNNRDLERLMQHLAENTLAHRTGIELLRSEIATMQMAIRERV